MHDKSSVDKSISSDRVPGKDKLPFRIVSSELYSRQHKVECFDRMKTTSGKLPVAETRDGGDWR